MNCAYCIYRSYFKYFFSLLTLLFKGLGDIIPIKFASFKLVVFKFIFMGKKYHSPLMPLAAVMINRAIKSFPLSERAHLKCITESNSCLIDTIEKLTYCNRVNGRLKIYDYGRFAITFYDSEDLMGIRVFIDTQKLRKYSPYLYDYFTKSGEYKKYDVYETFFESAKMAEKIISLKKVNLCEEFRGRGTGPKTWGVCALCAEAGHLTQSDPKTGRKICVACSEEKLFRREPAT